MAYSLKYLTSARKLHTDAKPRGGWPIYINRPGQHCFRDLVRPSPSKLSSLLSDISSWSKPQLPPSSCSDASHFTPPCSFLWVFSLNVFIPLPPLPSPVLLMFTLQLSYFPPELRVLSVWVRAFTWSHDTPAFLHTARITLFNCLVACLHSCRVNHTLTSPWYIAWYLAIAQ